MTEAIITRRLPRPVEADRVVVPGRCRADLERLTAEFGVPFERGPDELKDLPALFRQARPRARPVAPRHAHLRRDRRRLGARRRCHPGARDRDAAGGRRRDRSRLPARHAVPASRGRGARAEGGRLPRQRRFRRTRTNCGAAARPARTSCSASPNRRSTSRPETGRRAGADPGRRMATWRRCCAPRRRPSAAASRRSSIRSSIRSISASWTSLLALCRVAPPIARCGDPHGYRQPHRADRRRLRRRHRGAARHLLGAAHPQRAGRAGEPAHAPHHRGARRGAAHHVRGARGREPAAGLRRARCCSCTTASRFPTRRGEIAETRRRGTRRQFPHRDRGGRHPRLQSARTPRRAGCAGAVPQARGRDAMARMRSISAPN